MSKTRFSSFSSKQLTLLTWWCKNSPFNNYDAIICDGAVRSGKTLCMSISFVSWAFSSFEEGSFAICGKTVSGVRRNILSVLLPVLKQLGFTYKESISKNYVDIFFSGNSNRFYLFGGKDESSASLIQGLTLSGIMLDEAALMPRSFCEQAIARCSVEGSRLWFNCNPENPSHWFYREWIKKCDEKNCFYLHFKMEDNPSLSKEILTRYKSLYSGAFYERFVLGKWVAADGLVYPFWNDGFICQVPDKLEEFYVSCDYGTVNPTSMGLWGRSGEKWYRIDEFYHDSRTQGFQMTDEEYYTELEKLTGARAIEAVIVDPSAASFIECIKRHSRFRVLRANNDVLDGIRKTSDLLKQRKINICAPCKDLLREITLYKWEQRAGSDAPRKENDHAMDDMRYFASTVLSGSEEEFFALSYTREGRF